ncbi:MAG: hypothetical protein HYR64_01225 [Fimbriimonas ginsengisoli]|uniref:Uncharacterized protein n=1 Tax=Fimbriimonas ginsengisoli TaxID=1005039 RepID=A0A931PSR6_FIMGI|nr:hypothetical protein [Fimbriimonas ginsengisoli]
MRWVSGLARDSAWLLATALVANSILALPVVHLWDGYITRVAASAFSYYMQFGEAPVSYEQLISSMSGPTASSLEADLEGLYQYFFEIRSDSRSMTKVVLHVPLHTITKAYDFRDGPPSKLRSDVFLAEAARTSPWRMAFDWIDWVFESIPFFISLGAWLLVDRLLGPERLREIEAERHEAALPMPEKGRPRPFKHLSKIAYFLRCFARGATLVFVLPIPRHIYGSSLDLILIAILVCASVGVLLGGSVLAWRTRFAGSGPGNAAPTGL